MTSDFQALKNFNFNNSTVYLWVYKNSERDIRFRTHYVQTDRELNNDFKSIASTELNRITEQSPYSPITQVNESGCLALTCNDTDFDLLKTQVNRLETENRVTSVDQLKGTMGYVVKFIHNNITVYGVRRSSSSFQTKYNKSFINIMFSNGVLSGIQDNSFSIKKDFDFYVINNTIFMANKRGFETAMQHKDAYVDAFIQLKQSSPFLSLFTEIQPIDEYVGTNSMQLRRMTVVEMKGIYNNPNFLTILQSVNNTRQWGINFDAASGKIIPCANTMQVILQTLLDHRLISEVTSNMYDVPDATQL